MPKMKADGPHLGPGVDSEEEPASQEGPRAERWRPGLSTSRHPVCEKNEPQWVQASEVGLSLLAA